MTELQVMEQVTEATSTVDEAKGRGRKRSKKVVERDGVYRRGDRGGFWISWIDATGKRRMRKTDAETRAQARQIRASELLKVEQAKVLGFTPPGEEKFEDITEKYLIHQQPRLTQAAYDRTDGVINNHLLPAFKGAQLA